jgi:hypothetical protein
MVYKNRTIFVFSRAVKCSPGGLEGLFCSLKALHGCLRIKIMHFLIRIFYFFLLYFFLNFWSSQNLDPNLDSPKCLNPDLNSVADSVNWDPEHCFYLPRVKN